MGMQGGIFEKESAPPMGAQILFKSLRKRKIDLSNLGSKGSAGTGYRRRPVRQKKKWPDKGHLECVTKITKIQIWVDWSYFWLFCDQKALFCDPHVTLLRPPKCNCQL
jgi:hypothetical protein